MAEYAVVVQGVGVVNATPTIPIITWPDPGKSGDGQQPILLRWEVSTLTIDYRELRAAFPRRQYPNMLPNQEQALRAIAELGGSATLELPTGSGKTAIGYTYLKALARRGEGPLYYIVPNKTLVDQVAAMHPDLQRVYGRGEYDCLFYEEAYAADEIPCLSLRDCPHRVNVETGELHTDGAARCPYYQAKYEALHAPIVVCTASFYLYNNLFRRNFEPPAGLVIDEAHQIANVFRQAMSYEISDYHLRRSITLLRAIGAGDEADDLEVFLKAMVSILRRKPPEQPALLEDREIESLMGKLVELDGDAMRVKLGEAIASGLVDVKAERETLKRLEALTFDLRRYVRSFEYALADEQRHALNYVTYAYSTAAPEGREKVQYRLVIRAYYVAPLVRKLLSPNTLAYSATIGGADVFGFETGIKLPFRSLASDFPHERTRVFMPSDTPDLSARKRIRAEPSKVLRRVARMCVRSAEANLRSLVVVVSNVECAKFMRMAKEEGLNAITYGDGVAPREAARRFKAGQGSTLVGTVANYGEGIDLPEGTAPIIFFLRPGYPSPNDPAAQFEERRFGGSRWKVWNWRVMMEALQVRGRNVRSGTDQGVTIFVSQQFRSFLYGALPLWLREAYRRDLTLDECEAETLELLGD